jgi:hypothetical protein
LCRALLVGFSIAIFAQLGFAPAAVAQEQRIDFDIAAQPLDQALNAFGTVTGLQIFYETALTSGRRSRAVKGVLDRETALRALLAESNLTAHAIATNTISIAPSTGVNAELQQAKRASVAYYGFMQAGIMSVLCRNAETRPGAYRIAMQYWIDGSGRIARFKLITSSGDAERDSAIKQVMQTIVFQPSVRHIPQPVTLAIEPNSGEEPAGCAPNDRIDPTRVP